MSLFIFHIVGVLLFKKILLLQQN